MSVCCIWCRDNSKFKLRMYHAFSNKLRKKGLKATLMWSQLLHTCTETVDITGFWGFFANFLQLCQTGLWSSPLVINWVHFAFHFTTKRHAHSLAWGWSHILSWLHDAILSCYLDIQSYCHECQAGFTSMTNAFHVQSVNVATHQAQRSLFPYLPLFKL